MTLIEALRNYEARRRALHAQVTAGAHCVVCGTTSGLHAHHVLPAIDGGRDELDNLVAVCRRCHPTVEARTRTAPGRAALRSSTRRAIIRRAVERGSAPL
jgi:5-methylcytosine-specific restriction endonuclease McrA